MRKAASSVLAALFALGPLGCSNNVDPSAKPYTYVGCEDAGGVDCPGEAVFDCAMDTIWRKHASCTHTSDCKVATGPDTAECFNPCVHAAVNSGEADSYDEEVKVEAIKYCNQMACIAYPYCPRPTNAIVACVDGGCAWVEGVWKLPDAGPYVPLDAGPPIPPDASSAIPPDADTPIPPGLDASTPPPPGLDAATPPPPGLDAAAPPGKDAAAPPGLDAAAPPGLDAAAPAGLDADTAGLDADSSGPDV
jgi:hypothetical protein